MLSKKKQKTIKMAKIVNVLRTTQNTNWYIIKIIFLLNWAFIENFFSFRILKLFVFFYSCAQWKSLFIWFSFGRNGEQKTFRKFHRIFVEFGMLFAAHIWFISFFCWKDEPFQIPPRWMTSIFFNRINPFPTEDEA